MRTLALLLWMIACQDPSEAPDSKTPVDPDVDGDGYLEDDCDPESAQVHPGATEFCNGIDDDCDGELDEGVLASFWVDADADGFGDRAQEVEACESTAGVVTNANDCDDTVAAIFPGAVEVCDGVDNDCDTNIDENVTNTVWTDADGDGYGDPASPVEVCEVSAGFVANNDDCDDGSATVAPGLGEVCDGVDNDCDDAIDELVTLVVFDDLDGDGYGDPASEHETCTLGPTETLDDQDCDDAQSTVSPAGIEACNTQDDDCDGDVDEAGAIGELPWYRDADRDGYGDPLDLVFACDIPSGYGAQANDCDDLDPAISPAGVEVCGGLDDDCDGLIDEEDPTLSDGLPWYLDADLDGFGDPAELRLACDAPADSVADNTDCDDLNDTISPVGIELCNTLDDDCDGLIDDADVVYGTGRWYVDADGDGFGVPGAELESCEPPPGTAATDDDCDDTNVDVSPLADELCNGIDDDCDGTTDEDSATDAAAWYLDADGDGYGRLDATIFACAAPAGYVADATDCDDLAPTASPDGAEVCDGLDNDCDGATDDADPDVAGTSTWYADDDDDGYGDPTVFAETCTAPAGFIADDQDCDDTEAADHPGSFEACDGRDNDCDGRIDQNLGDSDRDGICDEIDAEACDGDDNDGDGDADEGLICDYTITDSASSSGIYADDDLRIYLDGSILLDNYDYAAGNVGPVHFSATPGQILTFYAYDSYGVCRSVTDAYICLDDVGVCQFLVAGYGGNCGWAASSTPFWSATVAVPGAF